MLSAQPMLSQVRGRDRAATSWNSRWWPVQVAATITKLTKNARRPGTCSDSQGPVASPRMAASGMDSSNGNTSSVIASHDGVGEEHQALGGDARSNVELVGSHAGTVCDARVCTQWHVRARRRVYPTPGR